MRGMALLLAACLAGCSLTPAQAPPPARFDLGPASTGAAGAALQLGDIAAPPWLDDTGIGYRLAYRDAFRREVYRDSRWVAPPSTLLAQRLRQQVAAVPAPRRVHLQLDEFEQVFNSPTQSKVVLRARARLAGAASTEHLFVIERDAPSADAQGAVRGLAAASDEFAEQLQRWLMEQR
jgi:cholesterol transport system auxiliary component